MPENLNIWQNIGAESVKENQRYGSYEEWEIQQN
jgi:hypothetical protein